MAFVCGSSWATTKRRSGSFTRPRSRWIVVAIAGDAPNRNMFRRQLENNQVRLCLIGMSNCGKSFRSSELEENQNFKKRSVDEEIEQVLGPELTNLGYSGIEGMASWMGFPYDDRFKTNERSYLEIEEQVMSRITAGEESNFVLDTTGSVIYMPRKILTTLREQYLIVHFNASNKALDAMIDNYFKTPKPVVWGDVYGCEECEEPEQALRRCYPTLLKTRRDEYNKLAHINIPAEITLSPNVDSEAFLECIVEMLSPCYKANR